jgi:hypothetical protein
MREAIGDPGEPAELLGLEIADHQRDERSRVARLLLRFDIGIPPGGVFRG